MRAPADCTGESIIEVSMGLRNDYAGVSERLAVTRLLEMAPRRNSLIVLNYHRIGKADGHPYDDGIFSATPEEFEAQVAFLKKRYSVVTLDEAVDLALSAGAFRGTAVLLTFDDGYLDNFTIAYPVLRAIGVQGTFFLVSSLVGSCELPWWDRIAYAVKNSSKRVITLDCPQRMQFDTKVEGRTEVIRVLLGQYKRCGTRESAAGFLARVEEACEPRQPARAERMFLDWSEASDMAAHGMAIGCHTHTHPVLSQLTRAEQYEELRTVKETLETRLGIAANVLAYPVGKPATFTEETQEVLQQLGYRAAFSYYGGINLPGCTQPFDIRRNSVDSGLPMSRLRIQLALASITGNYWF